MPELWNPFALQTTKEPLQRLMALSIKRFGLFARGTGVMFKLVTDHEHAAAPMAEVARILALELKAPVIVSELMR